VLSAPIVLPPDGTSHAPSGPAPLAGRRRPAPPV